MIPRPIPPALYSTPTPGFLHTQQYFPTCLDMGTAMGRNTWAVTSSRTISGHFSKCLRLRLTSRKHPHTTRLGTAGGSWEIAQKFWLYYSGCMADYVNRFHRSLKCRFSMFDPRTAAHYYLSGMATDIQWVADKESFNITEFEKHALKPACENCEFIFRLIDSAGRNRNPPPLSQGLPQGSQPFPPTQAFQSLPASPFSRGSHSGHSYPAGPSSIHPTPQFGSPPAHGPHSFAPVSPSPLSNLYRPAAGPGFQQPPAPTFQLPMQAQPILAAYGPAYHSFTYVDLAMRPPREIPTADSRLCASGTCNVPASHRFECGGCSLTWYCCDQCVTNGERQHHKTCNKYRYCARRECPLPIPRQYRGTSTHVCKECLSSRNPNRIPAQYCSQRCLNDDDEIHEMWCLDDSNEGPVSGARRRP
ncbi:hypothetical protein C8R45DRAFT_278375 [Mycena sanguinolenta]|nr:hypothetical protein C8R45DRAFT_278375 [Mycena sanguinolenta]